MKLERHAAALSFAAAAVFVAMTVVEFLYFRRIGDGAPSLDLRFAGSSPEDAMSWLNSLGPRGRESVIVWHYLTFDLVFPSLAALALASIILALGRGAPRFPQMRRQAYIVAAALCAPAALADYAQNVAVARLLMDPLNATPDSIAVASALVVAKFVAYVPPLGAIAFLWSSSRRGG